MFCNNSSQTLLNYRGSIVVVLHGGGFRKGSNCHPLYDGRWLAAFGDVVVAVPNYRLGPLGFLGTGERKPGRARKPGTLGPAARHAVGSR
ncbi:hypothetical protein MRX96_021537 [Rhipicephalus microplus]